MRSAPFHKKIGNQAVAADLFSILVILQKTALKPV